MKMKMNIINNNAGSIFDITLHSDINNIRIYDVYFKSSAPCVPSKITVEFNMPYIEAFSLWNAQCGLTRNVLPDWRPQHQISTSRLASGIPIQSVISQCGDNVFTISVNDAKTPIEISSGTEEVNGSCLCRISFFTIPIGKINEYKINL